MTETTRSTGSVRPAAVYVAIDLGKTSWTLAVSAGPGLPAWTRVIRSGDWAAWDAAIATARQRERLAADAPVESCYEAGRDGFWVHRALVARQVHNRVVDSSSIEVSRRVRQRKGDRIDALKLLRLLVRACGGEGEVWQEVHVPTADEEAQRHASRERTDLVAARTQLINQVRSWLATAGAALPRRRGEAWWTTVCDAMGAPLPAPVQARIARAWARVGLLEMQLETIAAAHAARVATAPALSPVSQLVALKGIAVTAATTLVEEGLVWRQFRNRAQVGALFGFAPQPYDSGEQVRGQRTRGTGHRRLKTIAIQLAWNWVRWQRHSALTRWYLARFGTGQRARRVGIVALARKLMIALWHYVTHGVRPTDAVLSH